MRLLGDNLETLRRARSSDFLLAIRRRFAGGFLYCAWVMNMEVRSELVGVRNAAKSPYFEIL